jgi:DNA replication and repair protein RecF
LFASQIHLNNFRNYREATVTAPPGLILVVGPNGAGKTNLLEAIHFLALGRSFRTSRDRDLVRRGEDALSVRATVQSGCGEQLFALDYGAAGKVAAVNDETIPRLIDYVGTLAVVAFGPDDLALAKGEPAVRRRFLDVWLGQENREYLYTLQRYYAVLRSRNALLARAAPRAEMEPYDHELVAAGARLTFFRAGAASGLAAAAAAAYGELAPEDEDFVVEYDPAVPCDGGAEEEIARSLEHTLEENRADEERRRQTLVGPHRDDLRLAVKGCDARRFASEGQQRTAALSLRVAQFRLLKNTRGDPPLLLLDDVASELDADRQRRLADVVAGAEQIFFTATNPPAGIEPDAKIRISEGQIEASG